VLGLSSISLDARIQEVSLDLQLGQWWFLLGPNGAGKSSLLSVMSGTESAFSGTFNLHGNNIRDIPLAQLASARCLVTQSYSTEFSVSVAELFSFFAAVKFTSDTWCPSLIEKHLELSALLNKPFGRLSGGEKQRVHLARNLLQVWPMIEQGKALILLDEPLQQMDIKHQYQALKLFAQLKQMGNLLVMSHHDLNHAMMHASHVCLLKDGKVVQSGQQKQVLTVSNLERLFEQAFTQITDPKSLQSFLISAPESQQM
jgi:ABC-type hemin transport system ATPase subunit